MKKIAKAIAAITLAFSMAFAGAADNSIYIDQAGDNTQVSVTQDGAGNTVRGIQGAGTSNTTPAKIYGDGNQVTVSQIGTGNTLNFGIVTTVAAGINNGNVYSYTVTGNNSTATINSNSNGQGISASNRVAVNQTGNNSNTNISMLGSANQITATTSGGTYNSFVSKINGDNNTQTVTMSGGGSNTATLTQGDDAASTTNNKGTIGILSVGASNTFNVSQTGGGTNGHSAALDFNGSGNTVGITQQGTGADSIVNLKSVGNTNTFTINSNTH
jgi:hypothetical protein